ncbi:MAG: benzoyl-CoA 2,3-epoxidase subunit BoxB [Candidatus Acidiferrales bacterium]
MSINYQDRIPNNVDLGSNRTLQRALEHWQPAYMNWWYYMGPSESHALEVYLRTATSVEPDGWAQFGYVRMPEYRWGIFLQPRDAERQVNFGVHKGQPAWQEVPGEYRSTLRRVIVTQGDTEPASVEQQRLLGMCCPSLYDLRNIFQVNVEEGRHLWAMVYLLHRYFGRDGREEAEALLERRSGDADNPRILGAFNEPTPDWLAFYMFTFFTDRDGKFQLCALAESGFDPLARTCRFMLTEEAHHMFVGDTGIARVIKRTLEVMQELNTDDPISIRKAGAVELPLIQKYLNFWFSSSLDLFGGDSSSNAASYFANGLKGRPDEARYEDHSAADQIFNLELPDGAGGVRTEQIPMRNAINEVTRDSYVKDCEMGMKRWNKHIEKVGHSFRMTLPSTRFRRTIGSWANVPTDPAGNPITQEEFDAHISEWLPTDGDRAFIYSLMKGVTERGKMAAWIAPPERGINNQPIDFEYVRLA